MQKFYDRDNTWGCVTVSSAKAHILADSSAVPTWFYTYNKSNSDFFSSILDRKDIPKDRITKILAAFCNDDKHVAFKCL